jgi:uncharacterized membrane protein
MAMDTLLVFAASYESVDDAVDDYQAVRDIWKETTVGDTYDAAVVTRQEDGEVKIVKHLEEPTIQGAAVGLGVGLAVGALVALFPAVAIGAGLVAGGAGGAGLGALAGHAAAGMSRSDLKDLGELLDEGQSGLLVVAAQDRRRAWTPPPPAARGCSRSRCGPMRRISRRPWTRPLQAERYGHTHEAKGTPQLRRLSRRIGPKGLLSAAGRQPRCHQDRRDAQPRPCSNHGKRMARGLRHHGPPTHQEPARRPKQQLGPPIAHLRTGQRVDQVNDAEDDQAALGDLRAKRLHPPPQHRVRRTGDKQKRDRLLSGRVCPFPG